MSEPLYTHDCRNGHHGSFCGMTPCDCLCHANERPAAPEVGRCGNTSPSFIGAPPDICALPAGHAGWHRGDLPLQGRATEWTDARSTAPDATAGDGLRSAEIFARLAEAIQDHRDAATGPTTPEQDYRPGAPCMSCGDYPGPLHERSDCPRAVARALLPALRDALAAAARDAKTVRRVEELAGVVDYDTRQRIRHALDGTT